MWKKKRKKESDRTVRAYITVLVVLRYIELSILSIEEEIGIIGIPASLIMSDDEDEMDEDQLAEAQKARADKSNRAKLTELLERMTVKELFDLYDKDKSGFIDYEEFSEMLPQIGQNLGEAKALKFFRMCDRDGSGEIDEEEFAMALYAFDGDSSNSNGYKPKNLLTPHDAFEMFDESGNGDLNEDELAFALEYLNLDVSGQKQEHYMRKFDLDGSGALEYPEFRKMWLFCCNPFEELKKRGIPYSRFARAAGLRVTLEEAVIREEQLELRAMAEAHAHHNFLLERKRRLRAIQRAFERAQDELAECLDLAGQVYMFGHGVTGQFNHGPALQEKSYIAPLGRYRGANEYKRYPYDLMGQPVSVAGEHDTSGDSKEGEDPDDETALEGSKRFGYLHEERELSRVVNMWTRRVIGLAKRPRSVRQIEDLEAEEAEDPEPELGALYGDEYQAGRAKMVFYAKQRIAQEEADRAAKIASGFLMENEDSEDSDSDNEVGNLMSLRVGGKPNDENEDNENHGEDSDFSEEEEEEEDDDDNVDKDETKSNASKSSKYSLSSYEIEKRARAKRHERAKERRRLKKIEEMGSQSVASTRVSGWSDMSRKVAISGSTFVDDGEVNPFSRVACCHSTAPLWGRRVISASIGHNLAYAITDMGEIIGWGGQNRMDATPIEAIKGNFNGQSTEQDLQGQSKTLHLTPRSALLKGFGMPGSKSDFPVGSDKNRRERRQKNLMRIAGETPGDSDIAKIRAIRSAGTSKSSKSGIQQTALRLEDEEDSGDGRPSSRVLESRESIRTNSKSEGYEIERGEYRKGQLLKPLTTSWIGLGENEEEDRAEMKECRNIHDENERDAAILKRVYRYFDVYEPSPSHGTQMQFLQNVLMPKVAHGQVKHALEVRSLGFGIRGKTKKELLMMLSKALRYELRYLGVRKALRIKAIEKELAELKARVKPKKGKRRIMMQLYIEAMCMWSPVRMHMLNEDKIELNHHAQMVIQQNERAEAEFITMRERQKQARDDCTPLRTVTGDGLSINVGGATFRGPEVRTPRGGTGAYAISAGGAHSAVVLSNGELYTWGAGTFGRLGLSEVPRHKWTGIKRKNPATIHRMKQAVREVESQAELDALLASPAYSAPDPCIVPRTLPAPTHEQLAKKEIQMAKERQLERMATNDPDQMGLVHNSVSNNTNISHRPEGVPPLVVTKKGTSLGEISARSGIQSSSSRNSIVDLNFIEGEGEEYNKAGAWERELGTTVLEPEHIDYMSDHKLVKVSCGATHTLVLTEIRTIWEGDSEYSKERRLIGGAVFQCGSAWAMSGVLTPKFELVGGKPKNKKTRRSIQQEARRPQSEQGRGTSSDAWMSIKDEHADELAREAAASGNLAQVPS
eukprot:g3074.t1